MNKIQRMSSYLVMIFNFLLFFLPASTICIWLFINTETMRHWIAVGLFFAPVPSPTGIVDLTQITNWPVWAKVFGCLGDVLRFAPFYIGILFLRTIFKNYRKGEIFTAENARLYRRIGILFFLNALLMKPISDMFTYLAVTFTYNHGPRVIAISLGTPNLSIILSGVLVTMIAWVMLEGCKINQEQQLTI